MTKFSSSVFALLLFSCTIAAPAARADVGTVRNGLPPTSTDSFVSEAGFAAELIYGDESTGKGELNGTPPPYNGFTPVHRIQEGIFDRRAAGLTTGHGSYMPSAWGRDEFLGAEFSVSSPGTSAASPQVVTMSQPGVVAAQLQGNANNLPSTGAAVARALVPNAVPNGTGAVTVTGGSGF
ncbi:MAG: hypothetical protein ACRD3W_20325 [Terriglobales bacterium]